MDALALAQLLSTTPAAQSDILADLGWDHARLKAAVNELWTGYDIRVSNWNGCLFVQGHNWTKLKGMAEKTSQ